MKSVRNRGGPETPIAVRSSNESTNVAAVVVPVSGIDLEGLERALIRFALEQTAGNRSRAARFLRLSRSALIYRMQKHDLAASARRPAASSDVGT